MESFEELDLSDEVMGAVKEIGISVPTEIQCIAVPAILEGKSVALGSHTGSGKTLAYMLPIVQVIFLFLLFSLYAAFSCSTLSFTFFFIYIYPGFTFVSSCV